MENIFGIIIFILFIVTRAMMDRNKGMAGKPGGKKKQPAAAPGRFEIREEPLAKTRQSREREQLKKQREPAYAGKKAIQQKPAAVLAEGESLYDALPHMEGMEPGTGKEEAGDVRTVFASSEQEHVLTNEDLRKAVIWSEILQKPRFRTKPRYSRQYLR